MNVLARISKTISIIGIPVFVFLCLLELVGRMFDPFGVSYYPEMARYLDTLIKEEPIGYRNQPGLSGHFFGTSVQINSHGMRDKEIFSAPTNTRVLRILFMGDSVPFGIGVEEEDTLPSQLERIINAAAQKGQTYEVLNMGVPSYNTEQELFQLKTIGLDLKPDLVMLLFSRNDIEPKMWVFEKRGGWIKNVIQRSYAGSLLFLAYREFRTRIPSLINNSHASSMFEGKIEKAFEGYRARYEGWQSIRGCMAEISSLLKKRGIPFVVILNQENQSLVEIMDHEAHNEGFHLFNLRPWQDPRWIGSDIREYVNSVADSHPNAEGNALLATLLHEKLIESKLLLSPDERLISSHSNNLE